MKPPKLPTIFRTTNPKQFNFEPRYYSERKEKMEQRFDRISRELSQDKTETSDSAAFRSNLKESWGYDRNRGNNTAINKRVLFYIIILVAVVYYFLR